MTVTRSVSRVLALASLSVTLASTGCFEDDEPLVISASSGSETGSGGTGDATGSSGTATGASATGSTGTGTGTSGSGTGTSSTTDATTATTTTTGTTDPTTTGTTDPTTAGTTDPTTTGTTDPTTTGTTDPTTTGTTDPTTTGTTDPTTTGTTDPTTTGTTGDMRCEGVCAPPVPPQWQGPFALATGASCGDAWPTPEGAARLRGFVAGAGSCACSCSGTPTGNCSSSFGICPYTSSMCGSGCGDGGQISANQCYDPPADLSYRVQVNPPTGVSCGAGSVSDNLTEPSFSGEVQLCRPGAAPAGVCDVAGEACVPTPAGAVEAQLCIVREGDLACPADYPDKTLVYTGANDTRACPNSCSCGANGAQVCTASYEGFLDGTSCSDAQGASSVTSANDVCVVNGSSTTGGIIISTPQISGGQCVPAQSQVQPSGNQAPTGASTICCASPP